MAEPFDAHAVARELSARYPPGTPCNLLYPDSDHRTRGVIAGRFGIHSRRAGPDDVCVMVQGAGGLVCAWALEVNGERLMPVPPWGWPSAPLPG